MSNEREMNVERLETIAQWLDDGAIHVNETGEKIAFHMDLWEGPIDYDIDVEESPWVGDCGSAMCIGGATEQFFGHRSDASTGVTYAGKLLGLDPDTAHSLFYPWDVEDKYESESFPPARCAAVIRNLIKTGKVDWETPYED